MDALCDYGGCFPLIVGGAAWLISRSGRVAGWAAESPAAALTILLALFMFVVAVLSFRPRAFTVSLAPL